MTCNTTEMMRSDTHKYIDALFDELEYKRAMVENTRYDVGEYAFYIDRVGTFDRFITDKMEQLKTSLLTDLAPLYNTTSTISPKQIRIRIYNKPKTVRFIVPLQFIVIILCLMKLFGLWR